MAGQHEGSGDGHMGEYKMAGQHEGSRDGHMGGKTWADELNI